MPYKLAGHTFETTSGYFVPQHTIAIQYEIIVPSKAECGLDEVEMVTGVCASTTGYWNCQF